MSLRHVLLAAASPFCLAAGAAHAETVISTTTTTPVATATVGDSIRVSSDGAVNPTSAGAAITLNSNHSVNLEGTIKIQDVNDATGILAVGGATGDVRLSGTITIDESTEIKDSDGDGDNDGPFATGARRFGVRIVGPGAFDGSVIQTGGSIGIEGNDSAGISAETAVVGAIRAGGAVAVTGDRSYGVHAASTVGGDILITGAVTAQGADSVAVATDDDVGGRLVLGSAITATGFRYTSRPSDTSKLDADDLLIGGPAVRVRGDVAGGIVVSKPPADLDPDNDDEDGDGVADASQATGSVTSIGSAPAILVGSDSRDVRIGIGGTGVDAVGLNIKGSVQGSGVYDGVTATAIQLGGLGGEVRVDGGVRVTGSVTATAVKAGATAIRFGAGASTPAFVNADGTIQAAATASDAVDVRAIQLDAGASLTTLYNSGAITASITGAKGNATAILDASGSLRDIVNARTISAGFTSSDEITGRAVALDLRANTDGVTVRQVANASDEVTPAIVGDVLFGSGSARLELTAGTLTGAVAFGSGADLLIIDGGAKMTGALTDAGGGLAVSMGKGRLTATNAETVNLTSLGLGAESEVVFTADPSGGKSTRFDVSGTADIASGAKLGLRFASKLEDPASFTLVKAGTLNAGTLDQGLVGETPWLYKAELRVDSAQNAVVADVRRRTTTEMGLNAAEASAFDAVYANFDRDAGVRDALLAKTDEASFAALYDQFLPDYHGGLFHALAAASEAAGRAVDEEQPLLSRDGLRVWTQEIAFLVRRDLARSAKYDADGFGLAGGVEAPDTSLGTLGLLTSFANVNVDESGASAAESLTGSVFSAGVYWRENAGAFQASLSMTGGYAWLKSKRTLVDVDAGVQREAKSDWNGATFSARGSLGYTLSAGSFYVRPNVVADYFLFKEDGRTERGGGEAMNLVIEDRSSSQLAAFAGLTFGARFGEESAWVWVPELTAGWRQVSGDGADVTTARFVAGGPSFTLAAPELSGGGGVVRLALRGQGRYFDFAVEAGGEMRDDYEVYDGRLVARFLF
ncbi:MAG: autotransporter domain-containing protein [Phenylobacterium sp.]|uniref:autotransporter domain-containing protein n=1 Tax=Phenylobacterium sp. TaxID=1871053 RepID=UPI00391B902B